MSSRLRTLLCVGLFAVACIDLFFRFSSGALAPGLLFNADGLYLPALFRDLFVDAGRFADWRLTPSPYFVPDMALYFLLDGLIGPFTWAVLVYAALQLGLTTGAAIYLGGRIGLDPGARRSLSAVMTAIAVALLLACASGHGSFVYYALVSATHFSLVPITLVLLPQALACAQSSLRGPLAFGCAVTVVMSASDPLFVPTTAIPWALAAGAFLILTGHAERRSRALTIAGAVVFASAAGVWASKLLTRGNTGRGFMHFDLRDLGPTLGRFFEAVGGLFARAPVLSATWALFFFAAVAVVVSRRSWVLRAGALQGYYLVCLFTVLTAATTFGAVVLAGLFDDSGGFRYFLVPLSIPLLAVAPLTFVIFGGAIHEKLAWASVGAAAAGWGAFIALNPWDGAAPSVSRHHPALARCLDARRETHALGRGISDYWAAKPATLFSRTGLRVVQVEPDFMRSNWINSREWYAPGEPFDFVVTSGLHPERVLARFGQPASAFRCEDGTDVYVYGDGLDEALRKIWASR